MYGLTIYLLVPQLVLTFVQPGTIRNLNRRALQSTIVPYRSFSVASRLQQSSYGAPKQNGTPTFTDDQAPNSTLARGDLLQGAPARVKVASKLREKFKSTTETYVAYGSTENLFKTCAAQADYKIVRDENGDAPKTATGEELGQSNSWWYKGMFAMRKLSSLHRLTPIFTDLDLSVSFSTWAQVTFLHMYILTVRLRLFPAAHAPTWHQHLIDHFSFDAEQRMSMQHGVSSGSVRSRYLKDLFVQWRGVLAAYDEGLVKGDAVMATAVWRNIFKGAEDVDAVKVATVVSYLRREIARVGTLSDDLIANGVVDFGDPSVEKNVVTMKSRLMDAPLDAPAAPAR
jgi:cytochrome b pre-mRNA-processing protein 3